jgi:hypothetical protein
MQDCVSGRYRIKRGFTLALAWRGIPLSFVSRLIIGAARWHVAVAHGELSIGRVFQQAPVPEGDDVGLGEAISGQQPR